MLYNGASIANAGALAWVNNAGAFNEATSVRVGPGALVLQMQDGQGIDELQCAHLATPRGLLAASGMQAVGISGTDQAKTVNCLQEQAVGAASVFADFDFDMLNLAACRVGRLHVVGMGQLLGTGAPPSWLWADGCIDPAAVVDNGPGDWTINLAADCGVDLSECIVLAQHIDDDSQRLYSTAVSHVSDTQKRITNLREGAGGTASGLTDQRIAVAILKVGARPSRTVGRIMAAGKLLGAGLSFAWSWGAVDESSLTTAGAGEYSFDFLPDRQAAGTSTSGTNDTLLFAQARGPYAASELSSVDVDYSAAGQVDIWRSQEGVGGAASGYVDGDIDFLFLSRT